MSSVSRKIHVDTALESLDELSYVFLMPPNVPASVNNDDINKNRLILLWRDRQIVIPSGIPTHELFAITIDGGFLATHLWTEDQSTYCKLPDAVSGKVIVAGESYMQKVILF